MKPLLVAQLILCLLACATVQAVPPDADAATNDPVVALGKGFTIRRSEIDHVLKSVLNKPGDRLPPDADVHVINQLIEIRLVLQQATDEEIAAGGRKADLELANIQKNLSAPDFEGRLRATGMTADELHRMLAQEATAQLSLARQLGINVTDAEVREQYDDHPAAFQQPEQALVRELLLLTTDGYSSNPLPADTAEAKHSQIFELLKRVRAGEDFAALAHRYNEDPVSKGNGDELPPFRADQMEFGDLAFSMKTNQISDVLTNSDGYRIFQLLAIIPAHKIEFNTVAEKIKAALIGEQKRRLAPAYLQKLRTAAGVEILDARLKALSTPAEPAPPPPNGGQR